MLVGGWVNGAATVQPEPDSPQFSGSASAGPWVNAATLPPPPEPGLFPVPVGGGGHQSRHYASPCCGTGTTEIQHLELEANENNAQLPNWRSHEEVERERIMDEALAATDEELLDAARQQHVAVEKARQRMEETQRRLDAFNRAAIEDVHLNRSYPRFEEIIEHCLEVFRRIFKEAAERSDIWTDKPVSIVGFTGGPDSKGKKPKPHQARWSWKEQSMQGMRAVADPSIQQPGSPYYVGLKKTLELENDGNGNKWRAHEYTPLLPAHDDPTKLLPWVNSLRIVYKVDEPPSSNSSKRHRADDNNGPSNNGHRVSDVWKHMTRVHVQAPTDDNAPGSSNKKNNPYKLMYAICHHCDKVFNADPKNGTNNQSKHLANCKCDCPPATIAQGDGSHKEQDNTSAGPGCSSSWEPPSSFGFPSGVAYPLIPSLSTETRGEFLVPVGYTNQN